MIRLKRVYYSPKSGRWIPDARRTFMTKRITKVEACIDLRMREIALGTDLRRWAAHDPAK